MKNVRQFSFSDPEMSKLRPETVAAWRVLSRDHWKLFQIENAYVFTTRKDFMRRRLTSIDELDSILPPHAQLFNSLKEFESALKYRVAEWYEYCTYEMYEPYEDILIEEYHIKPKRVYLSDLLPFNLPVYLVREVYGYMSDEEMAAWSLEGAEAVVSELKKQGIEADPHEVYRIVAECIADSDEDDV